MTDARYQLRYLPLFFDDVTNVTSYITNELSIPQAATDLINAIESAILKRLPNCESFEPYKSKKDRKYPYYRIYVKNYILCRNFVNTAIFSLSHLGRNVHFFLFFGEGGYHLRYCISIYLVDNLLDSHPYCQISKYLYHTR